MVLGIIGLFVCFFLTSMLVIFIEKRKIKSNKLLKRGKYRLVVSMSNLLEHIGIFCLIFYTIFGCIIPIIWSDGYLLAVLIGVAAVGSFFMVIKSIQFHIVIENQNITVFPFLSTPYNFDFNDIKIITRQTKKRYEGYAERIIICTEQSKKIIVDQTFIGYRKLIKKLCENIDQAKLKGDWETGG